MINSVSSNNMMPPNHPPKSQPLTDDQKQTVSDIISKYDSSHISDTDLISMMTEIHDAGIVASRELGNMVEEAGFDKPEGRAPEGAKGGGRPEPPQFAQDLMEKINNGDVTEEEIQLLLQNLQKEQSETQGVLVNEFA